MKATRYMRKPFFPFGFTVTEGNMEQLAIWCEGQLVKDKFDRALFIRVPVDNPRVRIQSEARVGDTIMKAKRGNRFTFKVYRQEWLDQQFFVMTDDETYFGEVDEIDYEEPEETDMEDEELPSPAPRPVPGPRPRRATPGQPLSRAVLRPV